MSTEYDRDRALESLLRARPIAGEPAGECLDAETLAAWVEGGLRPEEQDAAEAHAATCDRCAAVLASMMGMVAERVTPLPFRPRVSRAVRWLAPLVAAAAALTIWVAVRSDRGQPSVAQVTDPRAASEPPAPGPAAPVPAPAADTAASARPSLAPAVPGPSITGAQPSRRETRSQPPARADVQERAATAESIPVQAAASAAPTTPPATAPAAEKVLVPADAVQQAPVGAQRTAARALAPVVSSPFLDRIGPALIEVVSPDPTRRWRVFPDGMIQGSLDRGANWTPLKTSLPGAIVTGSAPAATVCWLVGRSGLVLLTIDGRTWREVTLVERVDLIEVRAVDAAHATVRAADGRRFATADGGATWTLLPLQEFFPAPF